MRSTRFVVGCGLAAILVAGLGGSTPSSAQNAVAVGDIVQTGVNGQNVVGEVIRIRGNTADLNLGQNNVSQLVAFDLMKVLQKAGAGAKSTCAIGDTVRVPYVANTVMTGRLMKTNGAYCEFDSSGSGFTGWAEMLRDSRRVRRHVRTGRRHGGSRGSRGCRDTATSRPGQLRRKIRGTLRPVNGAHRADDRVPQRQGNPVRSAHGQRNVRLLDRRWQDHPSQAGRGRSADRHQRRRNVGYPAGRAEEEIQLTGRTARAAVSDRQTQDRSRTRLQDAKGTLGIPSGPLLTRPRGTRPPGPEHKRGTDWTRRRSADAASPGHPATPASSIRTR